MIIVVEEKFFKEDTMGNKMFLRILIDEKGEKQTANIHLKLLSENQYRHIGTYYFDDSSIYVRRESDKHFHRKTKSYGFNHELINDPYLNIKWIVADIDGERYRFPKSTLKEFGTFLQFKNQGFELQRFLRFDLIKPFKQTTNQQNSTDENMS